MNSQTRDAVLRQPVVCALLRVGRWLRDSGYHFITVTPSTHARVLRRAFGPAESLADIFGWNLPFNPDLLPPHILCELNIANVVERSDNNLLRMRIRFSTLGDSLFLHSGYPTAEADSVFFGPDTYRFAVLIARTLPLLHVNAIHRIADIGCGTGAGAIITAKLLGEPARQLSLTDINPLALTYAAVNLALAQTPHATLRCGDLYEPVDGTLDLIIANPPYLLDPEARHYRHGGGELGDGLSLRIVREGLSRLAAGGTLILYTASAIVGGKDRLYEAFGRMLDSDHDLEWNYGELDPDVFGEELDKAAYRRVERIAAVSLLVCKNRSGGRPA
ncbi:MAG TPA: class I SAM-dependent methyltransferase [Gammaproteobacteria bacterium]|nr:class I SAM-dependent methyltransferase [Gammaproteobacteria bacterium]